MNYKNSVAIKLVIVFSIIFMFVVVFISKANSLILNIYPTDSSKNEQPFMVIYKFNNNIDNDQSTIKINGTNWLYLIKAVKFFDYKGNSSITLNSNKTINIDHLRKLIGFPLPPQIKVSIINSGEIPVIKGIGLLSTIYYSCLTTIVITTCLSIIYYIFYYLVIIINRIILQLRLKESNTNNQNQYVYFGLFLLFLNLFVMSFNYLTNIEFKSIFYNSDELFFPAIMQDLWHGGNIFKWNLSLSTFLFPDYILFCLAYLISNNIDFMFLIYFNIQFILFFFLIVWLFSAFFTKKKSIYFAGCVSVIFTILAILPFNETNVYKIQLLAGFHFGAFLIVLILLNFMIRGFTNHTNQIKAHTYYSLGLIFILSTIGALSDIFIIIWFLVPSIITLIILYIYGLKNLKLVSSYLFASIIGSLFGLMFLAYFHVNSRGGAHLIAFNSGAIFKQIFLAGFFIRSLWILSITFTMFWFIILISTTIIFKNYKSKSLTPLKFMLLFYLLSTAIILFVEFFVQNLGFTDRYMLPSFIFPIIIVMAILCNLINDYRLIVLLIFILAITVTKFKPTKISLNEYYPEDVRCLDQALAPYKVSNGIAQYWDARFYTLLSKSNLKIYSVDGSTLKQFEALSPTKIPNTFDFVIINTQPNDLLPAYALDEKLIYEINGNPLFRLTSCKNRIILIYKKDGVKLNH